MGHFSVLHITKYKELGGIGSHIDRRNTPTNVDPSKTHLNEEMVYQFSEKMTLEKCVEKRIDQGYRQARIIRKDAVRALGIILGGTDERMKEIENDQALFYDWKRSILILSLGNLVLKILLDSRCIEMKKPRIFIASLFL